MGFGQGNYAPRTCYMAFLMSGPMDGDYVKLAGEPAAPVLLVTYAEGDHGQPSAAPADSWPAGQRGYKVMDMTGAGTHRYQWEVLD